jgi:hypothetical protein
MPAGESQWMYDNYLSQRTKKEAIDPKKERNRQA